MSKFCPLANQVTNCTENCKDCLEEETKWQYKLTLCAGSPDEQIVYARLSKEDLDAIAMLVLGEPIYHTITLDNGEIINIEIVDCIEKIE